MPDPRHQLGADAEEATAAWLARHGWTILARRCRPGIGGELDLVSLDPTGVLVGVEVRARRSRRAGAAIATVDARRVGRLRLALAAYATASRTPHGGLRIDLVTAEPALDRDADRAPSWTLTRVPGVG